MDADAPRLGQGNGMGRWGTANSNVGPVAQPNHAEGNKPSEDAGAGKWLWVGVGVSGLDARGCPAGTPGGRGAGMAVLGLIPLFGLSSHTCSPATKPA